MSLPSDLSPSPVTAPTAAAPMAVEPARGEKREVPEVGPSEDQPPKKVRAVRVEIKSSLLLLKRWGIGGKVLSSTCSTTMMTGWTLRL